jgi:nucleoid-associated protein YgaU
MEGSGALPDHLDLHKVSAASYRLEIKDDQARTYHTEGLLKPAQLSGDSYTVATGETLWGIAGRRDVFGDAFLYPLIFKANQALLKDPNNLPEGALLRIPWKASDADKEAARIEARLMP